MSEAEYKTPEECFYTDSDEWVRMEADVAYIGITDFAQSELSDIVFIELPEVGAQLENGANLGVIESVKAVADLYAPFAGKVTVINTALNDTPELLNEDPYGEAWILQLEPDDLSAVERLMSAEQYQKSVEERSRS